jgi:transposase
MLDQSTRVAVLRLHKKGHGTRAIARALGISRGAVKDVLEAGTAEVPEITRTEAAEPYREQILEQLPRCKGNLVRVHEEIVATGAKVSYQALTAYCRRHGIGHEPPEPVGQYHFEPGEEAQHDTSPHDAIIGGSKRRVQTASMALCYSRMLFFQCSPRFQRFDCKVFLTEALQYFGGACATTMIDNTHVVVLKGTGAQMVPVPEMEAFSERYGFVFRAHALGDANRSARVERPFHYIEHNFFPGRSFSDWTDLNAQAREWCERTNGKYKRHLRAVPRELFAMEQARLKPLPVWVPEVYRLYHRMVDLEGYVSLHTNRYSAPAAWLGRGVEVRETQHRVELSYGRQTVSHLRVKDALGQRVTTKEHRPPRWTGPRKAGPSSEEQTISQLAPELLDYLAALKRRGPQQTTLALRQLLRMIREYPRGPLREAIAEAERYGLFDLERVERMVLRRIAHDYFRLKADVDTDGDE